MPMLLEISLLEEAYTFFKPSSPFIARGCLIMEAIKFARSLTVCANIIEREWRPTRLQVRFAAIWPPANSGGIQKGFFLSPGYLEKILSGLLEAFTAFQTYCKGTVRSPMNSPIWRHAFISHTPAGK